MKTWRRRLVFNPIITARNVSHVNFKQFVPKGVGTGRKQCTLLFVLRFFFFFFFTFGAASLPQVLFFFISRVFVLLFLGFSIFFFLFCIYFFFLCFVSDFCFVFLICSDLVSRVLFDVFVYVFRTFLLSCFFVFSHTVTPLEL